MGWVDSIEHAAKSIDLSWGPEFGWIDLEEDKIEDYDLQVPQKSRSHPHASPRSVVITASHFPKNGSYEYKNYRNSINLPDEDFDDFVKIRAQFNNFVTMRTQQKNQD